MAFTATPTHRLAASVSAHRRWVVLAMLSALHLALIAEPGGAFQRIWLLVHFGLFLLWQPFIAAERELEVFGGVLLLLITAVTIYFMAGWLVVAWVLILLGILGGRVFTVHAARRSRFYLVAFAYLLAILVLYGVPALLLPEQTIPEPVALFSRLVLPLSLLALIFLPLDAQPNDSGQVFDFFYAVLVFQLGLVLVLGSVALMRLADDFYFASVALTMVGFGAALFVLAVLWNPMGGFGGLRTYFSRYLLSVGMPFEVWVRRIAELAETENDSRRFLEQSFHEIAAFSWISGGHWRSPDGDGQFGTAAPFTSRFTFHELEVSLDTAISLSPALFLHLRLLAQVVGEFYEGKRRENALRRNAYLQAVHETGARLTHDVKNLLQSLYALTSVEPGERTDAYVALLRSQLPQLAKRLHATLEKLRAPEVATAEMLVPARAWWSDVERRLAATDIALKAQVDDNVQVPSALFDSFVENAVENARSKREREPGIGISVVFECGAAKVDLSVCDTGSAVPEAIVVRLFRDPIERAGALGIGLYQAARQARLAGYRLQLAHNRAGDVCFTLSKP